MAKSLYSQSLCDETKTYRRDSFFAMKLAISTEYHFLAFFFYYLYNQIQQCFRLCFLRDKIFTFVSPGIKTVTESYLTFSWVIRSFFSCLAL